MIEEIFGTGPAAQWVSLIYFIAGALGTAGRVWLSPELENKSRRMTVETLSGGAAGMLLPHVGTALVPEAVWNIPVIYRAAAILLTTGGGSLVIGDVIGRFGGGGKK